MARAVERLPKCTELSCNLLDVCVDPNEKMPYKALGLDEG